MITRPVRLARLSLSANLSQTRGYVGKQADHVLPYRRLTSPLERDVLGRLARSIDFTPLAPERIPRGWRLADLDAVPGAPCLATLVFHGWGSRLFRLTLRTSVVHLGEELAICGYEYSTLRYEGRTFELVNGAYVQGEPVDGYHWHRTRRVLMWEQLNVICSIEWSVATHNLRLDDALEIASTLTPAAL